MHASQANTPAGGETASHPPLARVAALVSDDGRVQFDLPCRRCAYNLRSLARGGQCPECGFAVKLSLRRGDLIFSDAAYVRRLMLGAHLLLVGTAASLAFVFMFSPAFGALGGRIVGFALAGVAVAGTWLVTSPDPSGLGEAEYGRPRRMTRLLLPATLLIAPITTLRLTAVGAAIGTIVTVAATLAYVGSFIGVLALVHYLRRLAGRMRHDTAARELTFCLRAGLISVPGLTLVIVLLARFRHAGPTVSTVLALLCAALGICLVGTVVGFLGALWTIARALAAEAVVARQLAAANETGDAPAEPQKVVVRDAVRARG